MYTPSPEILDKYAQVLVNFALNSGEGVKPGDVVLVQIPEAAKPFYVPLRNTILKAGANPIMQYLADGVSPEQVYELASDEQLTFFPDKYLRGTIDQIDHRIALIAESDKYALKNVDPKKIFKRSNAMREYFEWMNVKEAAGKYTWTAAMYGTEVMASDVDMSLEEYWAEIIKACFLDEEDPIAKWKEVSGEVFRVQKALNDLHIDSLHVEAEGIDLTVGLGPNRSWMGGSGRNIPSFEVFISPDWRRTNGVISFNQPLYRYGNVIEGIRLEFKDGLVVKATATKNEHILKEMVASKNADKIGEYSLTDGRLSKITRLMGETLYDENIGGPEGNTHMALGNAYQDSFPGDPSTVTQDQWEEWGYNQSPVHTDIISTAPRTVTATLPDGSTKIIYQAGKFLV